MDDLQRFVEQDAFARYLGIELVAYGDGQATARMVVAAHHLNSANYLHGGTLIAHFRGTVYRTSAAIGDVLPR